MDKTIKNLRDLRNFKNFKNIRSCRKMRNPMKNIRELLDIDINDIATLFSIKQNKDLGVLGYLNNEGKIHDLSHVEKTKIQVVTNADCALGIIFDKKFMPIGNVDTKYVFNSDLGSQQNMLRLPSNPEQDSSTDQKICNGKPIDRFQKFNCRIVKWMFGIDLSSYTTKEVINSERLESEIQKVRNANHHNIVRFRKWIHWIRLFIIMGVSSCVLVILAKMAINFWSKDILF